VEAEHQRLQATYDALVQTRVTSAGPVVQWTVDTLELPASGGKPIRGLVRFLYYTVFGRWPRVTMLNPLWAATQPLLQAIEAAKAGGAKDALIVSEGRLLTRELIGLSGKVAQVTKAGFFAGLFKTYIEPRKQFDLFVVDLNREDLSRFKTIVEIAEPYMRPHCTVVGFYMNRGRPLESVTLPHINGELVFAGSAATVRAMSAGAARLANGDIPQGLDLSQLLRWVHYLFALPLHLLRFWRANRAAAADAKQGRTPELHYRTSATVIAYAPWLVDEAPIDPQSELGAVERAAACGTNIGPDIGIPLSPENPDTSPLTQDQKAI